MKSTTSGVILAALALIAASVACEAAAPTSAPAVATAQVAAAPTNSPVPTTRPEPTPTADPCISWDEVTTDMKGETVCVRGIISKFSQSRQVGTRYQFSDKSNSFFLFSNFWEITSTDTGKTIGAGTCVEVTGPIEVESAIPFIHIDDLITGQGDVIGGFLYYDDTGPCQ